VCFWFSPSAGLLSLKEKTSSSILRKPKLLDKALNLIHTKKSGKLLKFIRLSKDNGAIKDRAADDLISYIETKFETQTHDKIKLT